MQFSALLLWPSNFCQAGYGSLLESQERRIQEEAYGILRMHCMAQGRQFPAKRCHSMDFSHLSHDRDWSPARRSVHMPFLSIWHRRTPMSGASTSSPSQIMAPAASSGYPRMSSSSLASAKKRKSSPSLASQGERHPSDSVDPNSDNDAESSSQRPGRDGKPARVRVRFSCVQCSRRKQKCDRKEPCSQCVARKVPQLCRPFPNGVEDPNE